MYKISKGPQGIVLVCRECAHVERINSFGENLGNCRTQAAHAMQKHFREMHGVGSVAQPVTKGAAHHPPRLMQNDVGQRS